VVMSTEHPASVDLLPHQLHSHRLLISLTGSVARKNIRGELRRILLPRTSVNKIRPIFIVDSSDSLHCKQRGPPSV
jgi:hypothetical protein